MKHIILTGGGSAGHVSPNIMLYPYLKEEGYKVSYMGGKKGIEKELIPKLNIDYYEISNGKIRRYFDFENFIDFLKVLKGILEAYRIIKKLKPNLVFSKGGYVSVPVVLAAFLNKVPILVHESDITSGLANRLGTIFAKKVFVTFPETLNNIKKSKGALAGPPIREDIFKGDKQEAIKITNFKDEKPVILVIGGSLGSVKINEVLRKSLSTLLKQYNIIHICGKNNIDYNFKKQGYFQVAYANEELKHFFAYADIIISRAGSNTIFEIAALKKPNILIPLSKNASRGDQILNAKSFENKGLSYVLQEEDLTTSSLTEGIKNVLSKKYEYIKNMQNLNLDNTYVKVVLNGIKDFIK